MFARQSCIEACWCERFNKIASTEMEHRERASERWRGSYGYGEKDRENVCNLNYYPNKS